MNARVSSPAHNTRGSSASSFASSSQQSPNSTMPVPAPRAVNPASTDTFLKDFTLIAEAAKRAQVAVMVRDFEDCAL